MIDLVIMRAGTRAGHGGSPTAIAFEPRPSDAGLDDAARIALAQRVAAAQTASVHLPTAPGTEPIDVHSFTTAGRATLGHRRPTRRYGR